MTEQAEALAVRKSVSVPVPPERAFAVFTGEIGRWWPLDSHHIGAKPAAEAVVEPHEGGRWFERAEDGSECDWGRVLAWEPPGRVVLSWEISTEWQHDPAVKSEVEVRFLPDGESGTRVELEHRGLDTFGDRAEEMREAFGSPGGWSVVLDGFAAAAAG